MRFKKPLAAEAASLELSSFTKASLSSRKISAVLNEMMTTAAEIRIATTTKNFHLIEILRDIDHPCYDKKSPLHLSY